jgi:recombination protein RecT
MTNVRNAVAKRDEAAVEAAAQPTVAQVVRKAIEAQSSAFRTVLPRHVDPDRFSRLTLAAVKSTPELMQCFRTEQGQTSVLLAAMQAAAVGLEPNTPTQDAWLLPRRNGGTWEAQLMIGYRGLLKLARRSGTIETIYAEVVREGDRFDWSRGLDRDVLDHTPGDGTGELTHAYAVARYKAGGYSFMVLNRAQVEARRNMSDSFKARNNQYSPWVRWPEAMWRKSAIRALIPFLDLSPDAERVVHLDEKPLQFDDEAGVIEVASAFGQLGTGDDEAPAEVDVDGVIDAQAEPEAP